MLRNVRELYGVRIHALDGDIGHVKDFYYDDTEWVIRYLVVDTGNWFSGRKVLIAPEAFGEPDHQLESFPVKLTMAEIENSPSIEEHRPVTREHEYELNEYYNWKIYWAEGPVIIDPAKVEPELEKYCDEPNLRSALEVTGYHINATDGEIGHVEDIIIDDESWKIRYIEIDTRNILHGKKVLLSPLWIEEYKCHDRKVLMSLNRNEIRNSPPFHDLGSVDPGYEEQLYEHYGKKL